MGGWLREQSLSSERRRQACAVAVAVAVAGEGGRFCWDRSLEAENTGALNGRANGSDDANFFLTKEGLFPSFLRSWNILITFHYLTVECLAGGRDAGTQQKGA